MDAAPKNSEFTPAAERFWQKIPREMQRKLLANVFCGNCTGSVTIYQFTANVENGNLILDGKCKTCDGSVGRLIEGL
jgi:hypothetical protein